METTTNVYTHSFEEVEAAVRKAFHTSALVLLAFKPWTSTEEGVGYTVLYKRSYGEDGVEFITHRLAIMHNGEAHLHAGGYHGAYHGDHKSVSGAFASAVENYYER